MTREEFAEQILAMQQTMYRVSCGILRREVDREDAVQECICKAWQKKDTLKDEGAFRAWVLRILVNECYDICRRSSRTVLTDEIPESIAPSDEEPRNVREAILQLEESNLLSSLPDELERTARLRLLYPDLSLTQLAAVSVPPISKSGLSHRLKRIMDFCEETFGRAAGGSTDTAVKV